MHLKKKDFIYLFLDRGEGREWEERNISVWLPLTPPPNWRPGRNPGMCTDWESKQPPFGSQAGTQSAEPHQPGLIMHSWHDVMQLAFTFVVFIPQNP